MSVCQKLCKENALSGKMARVLFENLTTAYALLASTSD
jgi:hypothetical protein